MSRFNEAYKIVLGHEGGYQNLHNDRGNWTTGVVGKGKNKGTKYGITAMSYPDLDIINLTLDDARQIYKENYWDRINGDKLEPALALVAFDTAINSGVGRAIEFLNKTDDVTEFLRLRRSFIRSLRLYGVVPTGNKSKRTYGQIWEDRITQLEAQAATWAIVYPATPPASSPEPQEGASDFSQQVLVLLDVGQGFMTLTERYAEPGLTVNAIGNKVFIRSYR